MSGGSYNYLYTKEIDELLHRETELEEMMVRLNELGYAKDFVQDMYLLIHIIKVFKERMELNLDAMRPIWKAVEFYDSADWTEESIHEALEEYRNQ